MTTKEDPSLVSLILVDPTKIINFNTPMAEVLMLGRGHINHFSEYVLSYTLSIYSTLIAIVLRDYDAAFRYHS